ARITQVAVTRDERGGQPPWFERFLAACERRPELTSLICDHETLNLIASNPLLGRLTSITISRAPSTSLRTWPIGGRPIAMTLRVSIGLDPCIAGPIDWLGEIELSATGETVRVWGEWGWRQLPGALQYLPSTVKRVELEGEYDNLETVRRTAALFRLELV